MVYNVVNPKTSVEIPIKTLKNISMERPLVWTKKTVQMKNTRVLIQTGRGSKNKSFFYGKVRFRGHNQDPRG